MFDDKALKAITAFRIKTYFFIRKNRYQRWVAPLAMPREATSLPVRNREFTWLLL